MTRKLIALLLVVSMLFCMFSSCASKQETVKTTNVEVSGFDITVSESSTKREASTTVEGVPLKCERIYDTNEYWLYLNEEPIQLDIVAYEDRIEVCLLEERVDVDYEDKVVGQYVLTLSLATPAFISAAKALICTLCGVAATATVSITADALGNVIGGVRYNKSSYYAYRTVDITAADAIRMGRMRKYNAYYEAYLEGNTVWISKEINEWTAIRRLERGYDVFATSAFAAGWVAMQASTIKSRFYAGEPHSADAEGKYPHYHAYGRKWINDSRFAPHAWYPFD